MENEKRETDRYLSKENGRLRAVVATMQALKKKAYPCFLDLPTTTSKADAERLRAARSDFEKIDEDFKR